MTRASSPPAPRARLALAAAGAAALLAAAGAAPAAAQSPSSPIPPAPWVIDDRGPAGTTIAGFRVAPARAGVQSPRLRALVKRWGAPTRSRPVAGGQACVVQWTRPRVQAVVANFGLIPRGATACRPGIGLVQRIETLGTAWRTAEGLGIGASRARLRSLYPDAVSAAEGDPGILQLEPALHPCVPCREPEELQRSLRGSIIAMIPKAKVTRLIVQVGAAGD